MVISMAFDQHRRRDNMRDQELRKRGYRILRFSNGEIDREMDGVLETIRLVLASPHPAASRPPSPGGEG
jgi:very-short-patch-repair endonuclease